MTCSQPFTTFSQEFPYVYDSPYQAALNRALTIYDTPTFDVDNEMKGQAKTAMDILESSPKFRIFTKLVKDSGLESMYRDPTRKLTVFAVPDRVFEHVPEHIMRELDAHDAKSIISFSTLNFPLTTVDMRSPTEQGLPRMSYVPTLLPQESLFINGAAPSSIFVGRRYTSATITPTINYNAQIIGADNMTKNAIIHVISLPLLPSVY